MPNYHMGCLFRTEMSSTVYPRGCGWERDGSTCAVRAPLLFVHVPHLCGCVCERYKLRHNAPSITMPPPSPTTSQHHAPLLLTLSLIFLPPFLYTRATIKITICRYTRPLTLIDAILMVFASWYLQRRTLIIPCMHAGVCKKMHLDVPCNARVSC